MVVLPATDGPDTPEVLRERSPGTASAQVAACLASLLDQTLSPRDYEVLVVGSHDAVAEVVEARVRTVSVTGLDVGAALCVGAASARASRIVVLRPWERASRGLLAWLSADRADGLVPVADEDGAQGRERSEGLLLARVTGVALPRTWLTPADLRTEALDGAVADLLLTRTAQRRGVLVAPADSDDASVTCEPADAWRTPLDALTGVLRHEPHDAESRHDRRVALEAAAGRLRQVLLEHPELHPRVVAQVRRRRLLRMPWKLVNRGRAAQLGLLYCFPPAIDTSGLVAARRLEQAGMVTDVVCQDLTHVRPVAAESSALAAPFVDEQHVVLGERPFDTWTSVREWTEAALDHVADLEGRKGPYAQVYSRAMSLQSHVAAAVVKLRRPQVRWIAEFSDPMLHDDNGTLREAVAANDWLSRELEEGMRRRGRSLPADRRMYEWAEMLPYALADEIVFTNEHQRTVMLDYCRDPGLAERARSVSRVSHHPVPPPELYDLSRARVRLDPGRVHLAFFGTFYASRGLSEVVGALRALTPEERDRVEVHIFTNRAAVELEVIEKGLADVVTVRPMRGYLDYLHLTTIFDVLLVNDYATAAHTVPNPYLPAKLAEYVGSGRPIWAIVEPSSVLSHVSTTYRTELGDVNGALEVLREVVVKHAAVPHVSHE